MKSLSCLSLLCVSLLFATCALANETDDRIAISETISLINQGPLRAALFRADSNGPAVIQSLSKGRQTTFRVIPPSIDLDSSNIPTVTISHEPWGEATLNFPDSGSQPLAIRFIRPDLAMAPGECVYTGKSAPAQSVPLLFLLKKESSVWKIASIRNMAPR